ncbi:MAG: S8 family serine peptidase [Saprospiraceae bacterium]
MLQQLATGQEKGMLVVFEQQADFKGKKMLQSKSEKGRFVYSELQKVASTVQANAQALITDSGQGFQSFIVVNSLYTEGGLILAQSLASLPEVKWILSDVSIPMQMPDQSNFLSARVGELPYGLIMIGADKVWELGIRGQGVVVSGQDTGYDWEHPALINSYLGWNGTTADHNYTWHDAIHEINLLHNDSIVAPENNPCGLNSLVPCDDNSHGTHTMGTMVGDDGIDHQIGVAPLARWIGVRNMERGFGMVSTYLEAFNWLLAPTDLNGQNPDPSRAPHVVNNSWFCSGEEGCTLETNDLFAAVISNLKAAGIVVVVSAGNSGPSCETIAFSPALLEQSFTIGASNEVDSVSSFSSRGWVSADSSFRMKPDVVAPGSAVLSSIPGGNYAHFWGTSMAGPHVAGLVALIISANPALAGQVDVIEEIIRASAVPKLDTVGCSGATGLEVPNPTYGYGRVDAYKAVQMALSLSTEDAAIVNLPVVFPNPSRDEVWIDSPNAEIINGFDLYDALGKSVFKSIDGNLGTQLHISIRSLPEGIYYYRMSTPRTQYSGKLNVIQ